MSEPKRYKVGKIGTTEMIDCVSYDDYARLKAEVERLDTLCKQLSRQHSDISCENIMLRKAGDAMAEVCEDEWRYKLNGDIEYYLEMKPHKIPNEYFLVQAWNAAKEGKGHP